MMNQHDRSTKTARQTQIDVLQEVLRRVECQVETGGGPPVIEIDLDLAALMPIERTRRALAFVGEKTGVSLFRNPEAMALLPGYTDEAWASFLAQSGLPSEHPNLRWYGEDGLPSRQPDSPLGLFLTSFWTSAWLLEDEAAPGLCAWVERVEAIGGKVVFLSGRWLPEHVAVTQECLRRAGIPKARLLIGNDRHETLVPPQDAVSDGAVKASRQSEVLQRFGKPIVFVDDRPAKRAAVSAALGGDVWTLAMTIPGFTYDPENDSEPNRIWTWELYDTVLGDPPRHEYLLSRYGSHGSESAWSGLYEGIGSNRQPYAVRRVDIGEDGEWQNRREILPRPYSPVLAETKRPVPEAELLSLCEQTVPRHVVDELDGCMAEAQRMAIAGVAAPFPNDRAGFQSLRRALLASWLHSRDVECLMRALGFPLSATGVHDISEWVSADEVRSKLLTGASGVYSPWLLSWAETLSSEALVNVGCFNPAMAVGMWQWRPDSKQEDAMDVHRLSSHHDGDGGERYDPIEAAVNNLLHRREGKCGIRKEPVEDWDKLFANVALPSRAFTLGKTGLAVRLYRDIALRAAELERDGFLTPWHLSTAS